MPSAAGQNHMPKSLPHLPNELKIRIISFVEDPHFLWTTCRKLSPEFKQWSEERYAREFLPKLRLDMSVTPAEPKTVSPARWNLPTEYTHHWSEFFFRFKERSLVDESLVLLESQNRPWSVLFTVPDGQHPYRRKVPNEDDFELLKDMLKPGSTVSCQALPESELGLRPLGQSHVCPCRSLKDGTNRGRCQRYRGVERFFFWRSEEKAMEILWKEMLDFVHEQRCVDGVRR